METEKFSAYCQQGMEIAKNEDINSQKLGLYRKKLLQILIKYCPKDDSLNWFVNEFWRSLYYYPIRKFLAKNKGAPQASVLVRMYAGDFQELAWFAPGYASQCYLYIGDLHRYIENSDIDKRLARIYYTKSIELDTGCGRSFKMLGLGMEEVQERMRLFLQATLATNSDECKQELRDCLDMMDTDMESDEKEFKYKLTYISGKFIRLACFDCRDKQLSEHVGELFTTLALENRQSTKLAKFLEICVLGLASGAIQEIGGFQRVLNLLLELFGKVLSKEQVSDETLLVSCFFITTIDPFLARDTSKKQVFADLPEFSKNEWFKIAEKLVNLLNKSEKLAKFDLEKIEEQKLAILVNGVIGDGGVTPKMVEYWAGEMLCCKIRVMKMKEDGEEMFEAIGREGRRKVLKYEVDEKEVIVNAPTSKPIYVIMELSAITDHFLKAHQIWKMKDFVMVMSSSTLGKLDKMKNSKQLIRRVLIDISELQKLGMLRIIESVNVEDLGAQLVQTAKMEYEEELANHPSIATILCHDATVYEGKSIDGVTFSNITDFYNQYCG